MYNDLKKIIACIKHIGLKKIDINDYAWRFFIQKMTFLAQTMGLSTNYYFTINIKGPYSRDLTCDYYQNNFQVNSIKTDYELSQEEKEIIEKIEKNVFGDIKTRDDINGKMHLFESVSTVAYLMQESTNPPEDQIFLKTKMLKPHLNDEQIVIGINKAKNLLFKSEYLTDELKKEIELWDRIDA